MTAVENLTKRNKRRLDAPDFIQTFRLTVNLAKKLTFIDGRKTTEYIFNEI